ncbi:MAG: hypothetical protein AAGC53_17595 [Actinomycetota bacterium]
MSNRETGPDRLADLVASLSRTNGAVARDALEETDPGAIEHDPLAAVAAAMVALRRTERHELTALSA